MGFLNSNDGGGKKVSDIYLDLSEVPEKFRPLAKQPTSVWIHRINTVKVIGPDAQPKQLRKYATEICVSTGRSGAGCYPCTTQDPMWDKLEAKNKTNKKGARVDFPKACTHLLPVLSLSTGKVKILKGGNQLYEDMDKWFDVQPDERSKDLRRCEWQAYKTGKELFTKYNTVRLDATPFQVTPELEAEAAVMMEKAKLDMAPLKLEQFMEAINGGETPLNNNTATVSVPSVATSGYVQSTTATVPQQPDVPTSFSFEPRVSPIPVSAAPAGVASVVDTFSAWVNQQPEFQGMGALENLIPVLQEKIGGVNYHKCTAEQIALIQSALTTKLSSIRAKKA